MEDSTYERLNMFSFSSGFRVALFVELVFGSASAPKSFDRAGTGPLTHEVLLTLWLEALQSEDIWKRFEALEPFHLPFNETLPKGIYKKLSAGVSRTLAAVVKGGMSRFGRREPLQYDDVALRKVDCNDVTQEKIDHPASVEAQNSVDVDTVMESLKLSSSAYSILIRRVNHLYISDVCRRVCEEMSQLHGSIHCFANWYISPVSSCAHFPHLDIEENFVVQLSGAKRWNFYNTTRMAPHLDWCQEDDCEEVRNTDWGWPIGDGLLKTITLLPGDLLYFPRGLIHDAQADSPDLKQYGQFSSHVTFALNTGLTWWILLSEVLKARLDADPVLEKDMISPACISKAAQSDVAVEVGADASVVEQNSSVCPDILVQEKLTWNWFARAFIQFAARLNRDLRRIVTKRKESTARFSSKLQGAISALGTLLLPSDTSNEDPKELPDSTQHLIVQVLQYASSKGMLSKAFSKLFRSPKQLSKKLRLRTGAWLDSIRAKLRLKLDAAFMGTLISGKKKGKRKALSAIAVSAMRAGHKKVDDARKAFDVEQKQKYFM